MAGPLDDLVHYANDLTFTFGGDDYKATSISVSPSAAEFDVTTTEIADGGCRRYRPGVVRGCDIKVDWVGLTIPDVEETASFSISHGKLGHTGTIALCTGLSITAQAGELIKGSATFKVSFD
jgi:hypothetical protein